MLPINKIYQHIRARSDVVLRSVLKNSGWAATGQAVSAVVALGETILLARFLSIEMFGVFIVLASTTELIFGLLDFRTGEAVIKFLPELRQSRGIDAVSAFLRLVFMVDGVVAVAGFIIIITFGYFILQWLALPTQYRFLLVILGGGVALKTVVRSVGSYLRVAGSFSLSIKLGMVSMVFRLILLTIAVIIAPEIPTVSLAIALSDGVFFALLLTAAIVSFHSLNLHPWRVPISLIARERKAMATFLLSTNLAGTFRILSTKLDVIVIAALSSPAVVALYKVATRIAGTLMLFSDPLLVAVYPEMSQLHAKKAIAQLNKIVTVLTKILAIFAALLIIFFALFGKWMLGTLAGMQYVNAQPVALIMLIGTSLSMIFFWARPLLLVYGMASKVVLVALVALVVQFGCLFLMVPVMGVEGAGVALALYYFIMVSLFIYLLLRNVKFASVNEQPRYV
ncbi:MAG: lipopolysaccharide biosynthesis protein [bacterium]